MNALIFGAKKYQSMGAPRKRCGGVPVVPRYLQTASGVALRLGLIYFL